MLVHSVYVPVFRFSVAGISAMVVTFLLFLLMHSLVESPVIATAPPRTPDILPIVRLIEPPPPPPPMDKSYDPDDIPPAPDMPRINPTEGGIPVTPDWTGADRVYIPEPVMLPKPDTDPVAIVKVSPDYPISALNRGIEGYVILEFTVDRNGATKDIRVIEANPPDIFNRSAVRAVSRFKYKPGLLDGGAVETANVQVKLSFEIEK